jgi:quercetin dioxygenase-like cupin family protein
VRRSTTRRGPRGGRFLVPVSVIGLLVVSVAMSAASPPSGVTPTLIARGTYPEFKVKSARQGEVDFQAISRTAMDVVVRRHAYAPGGYTGWHSHPGPVLITVTKGELTFYEYDDGECKKLVLRAGQTFQPGYVDSGLGHFVRNESGQDAEDVSVIMAPTEQRPFRGELDPPAGCGS